MNAVTCTHVTRRFGSLTAVDDISLQVSDGEIFGIIGPNGAGKTTLLSSIEGLDEPTSGEVAVLGLHPVKDAAELARRTGIQLQQAALLPRLRVGEALELFSSFYDHPVPWRPLLERLGIASKEKTDVARLSGGERQRVFIALALVHDPELLFLDEPTTGFDPEARREFWGLVEDLADDGTTVLLTTHYLDEAAHLADDVAVVLGGRIVAQGAPADLARGEGEVTVSWLEDDEQRSVRTIAPTAVVRGLIERLAGPGGEVPGLQVTAPSLEDRYLELVTAHETAARRTAAVATAA